MNTYEQYLHLTAGLACMPNEPEESWKSDKRDDQDQDLPNSSPLEPWL